MYLNYFDKFKGMIPYLHIEAEEWAHIKATFDVNDVKESLADVAMTYELPYAEISEDEARKEYLALKGIRWNELFTEGEWFPRKASDFRYSLDFQGKPQYIRRLNTGNDASNHFQQANRWSPAEDADLTQYENHFDIVFSSPPYFNVERYSYDDTQSWVRYKNIDAWNKEFLHKTIANVWPTLKKGGILAVNIADVYASSKGDGKGYKEICNPMNDFIQTLGAEYEGCLGMEMAKRPGSAGAGAIIEGDEDRYTDEALAKAAEAGDKTFCEPIWIWKKL